MRKHRFVVELEFEDKISSDEEITELAANILQSLVHTADTAGLSPENSETFTKKIKVSNDVINTTLEHDLMENSSNGEDEEKEVIIDKIKAIIEECGAFGVYDVQADHSPFLSGQGKLSHLMEEFTTDGGTVYVYDPTSFNSSMEIDKYDADYYDLEDSQLEYVLELAEKWKEIQLEE